MMREISESAKSEKGQVLESPKNQLPKLCGADIELGNFIIGRDSAHGTGDEASRALLAEIDGLPLPRRYPTNDGYASIDYGSGYGYSNQGYGHNRQDWGRKYLKTNGGCVYIDLDHLELCLPEVVSAYDHVAAWHAMLRIARRALVTANKKLPSGQTIQVLVNNSDGQGHSYGSHLDFLITARAWEDIFHRKLHPLLFLAAFQASSIVFTGQGKVGAENGRPSVEFQLSQRADFMETLVGEQTTFRRPVVNSRDEALCGRAWGSRHTFKGMARLHVIFFDNTLCHVASLLKVGVMQIMLSMIEAERVHRNLILDDPLNALMLWSRDPALRYRSRMASGTELTAVELQLLFLEEARKFAEEGGCDGMVPQAARILDLWEDTLVKLKAGDLPALAPRLDWVLKLEMLQRTMRQRPELSWSSPQIKHLDHIYSSLDISNGLYWAYERAGLVERIVNEDCIERFTREPPEDTRAWTRAMLLRKADPVEVEEVNWDSMRFHETDSGYRARHRTLELSNPLAFTRAEAEGIFLKAVSLKEILNALGVPENDAVTIHGCADRPIYTI